MGDVQGAALVPLSDRAAIQVQCQHDALKPPLYLAVDLLDRYTDESGRQVTKELLEVRPSRTRRKFGWGGGREISRLPSLVSTCGHSLVAAATHQRRDQRSGPFFDPIVHQMKVGGKEPALGQSRPAARLRRTA